MKKILLFVSLFCLMSQGLMAFIYDPEEPPQKPLSTHGPFVDLNFLYWKPRVDGLVAAQSMDLQASGNGSNTSITGETTDIDMNFHWDPGFKVGLGYLFDKRSHYQAALSWTCFHSSGEDPVVAAKGESAKPSSSLFNEEMQFVFPNWIPLVTGPLAVAVSAHWSLNYNVIDLSLGRDFYLGKWLSIHPEAGVRAAWIYQKYNVEYVVETFDAVIDNDANIGSSSFETTNDFRGFGIKLGSDVEWHINSQFALVADGFFSLFYGHFQVNEIAQGPFFLGDISSSSRTVSSEFSGDRSFNSVNMAIETEIGLRWEKFFNRDKYRLRAGVFYQLALWPEQSQLVNEAGSIDFFNRFSTVGNIAIRQIPNHGDLQIQGWRFLVGFDF